MVNGQYPTLGCMGLMSGTPPKPPHHHLPQTAGARRNGGTIPRAAFMEAVCGQSKITVVSISDTMLFCFVLCVFFFSLFQKMPFFKKKECADACTISQ